MIDVVEQSVDAIRVVRILIFIFLFLIVIRDLLSSKSPRINRLVRGPLGWFLLYTIAAMISFLYSSQQLVSLWKGFELFVCITMAIYIYKHLMTYNDAEIFWKLNMGFLFCLILSAYGGLLIAPNLALFQMRQIDFRILVGVYPPINSNSLAQMAAILCAIFVIQYVYVNKKKPILLILAALMFPVLILAYGRTSLLALLVSIFLVLVATRQYKYFLLGVVAIGSYIYLTETAYPMQYIEKGTSLYTFSGRLLRWPSAWEVFVRSPVYGHGFYVTSRVIYASIVEIDYASTTDNTFFDVLLSVGIIGFIPFAVMLYTYVRKLIHSLRSKFKPFVKLRLEVMCVSIIIIFRSLTGPSISILHWNLILFLALIVTLESLDKYENSYHS